MIHSPRRNDKRRPPDKTFRPGSPAASRGGARRHDGGGSGGDGAWLWGWHAVSAALANPQRPAPRRLLASPERAQTLQRRFAELSIEVAPGEAIDRALGKAGLAHQGVALLTPPLAPVGLQSLASPAQGVILMLDQVTDPQNIGSIFRSAAAFGARGVILQDRHAPQLAGAAAKAAVGAIETVAHAREVNLARCLETLADAGWRTVGLAGEGEQALSEVLDGGPTVLVLGSEDEGLRRLVREHCDVLARIPMSGGFESLNVSTAAAVALYAAQQAAHVKP